MDRAVGGPEEVHELVRGAEPEYELPWGDLEARHRRAEQLPQPLLGAPQARRPDPRRGGNVPGHGAEDLPDEAGRGPVGHRDRPARPAHPGQLGRGPLLVGGEHHPDNRQHGVEGAVGEPEVLGVTLGELDLQALGRRPRPAPFQQLGHVVDAGHLAAAAGRGQGGVAVATGHVQHPLAGLQVGRLDQLLGHGHDPGGHGRVVAAGPGLPLAALDGGQVGLLGLGDAHALLLARHRRHGGSGAGVCAGV